MNKQKFIDSLLADGFSKEEAEKEFSIYEREAAQEKEKPRVTGFDANPTLSKLPTFVKEGIETARENPVTTGLAGIGLGVGGALAAKHLLPKIFGGKPEPVAPPAAPAAPAVSAAPASPAQMPPGAPPVASAPVAPPAAPAAPNTPNYNIPAYQRAGTNIPGVNTPSAGVKPTNVVELADFLKANTNPVDSSGNPVLNEKPAVGEKPAEPAVPTSTPAEQAIHAETTVPNPTNPTSPTATPQPNPVESGENTMPLHEHNVEANKTPLETTQHSTGVAPKDNTDYENFFREENKATPGLPTEEKPVNQFANVATEAKLKEGMEHPATPQETLERVEGLHPQLQEHLKTQAELLKGNKKFEQAVRTSEKLQPNEVFVPGYGNMDRKMHKDLGPELKREALSKIDAGTSFGEIEENPIVSERPKGGTFNQKNKELNTKFREVLTSEGRAIPTFEELKAEGKAPPTFKNMGRAMKIGGVAGTAILLSDLANAATPQQEKEAQRNLGESLLPIAATPTPVQSGTLPKSILEQYQEYGKLGSPYREAFLKQTGRK